MFHTVHQTIHSQEIFLVGFWSVKFPIFHSVLLTHVRTHTHQITPICSGGFICHHHHTTQFQTYTSHTHTCVMLTMYRKGKTDMTSLHTYQIIDTSILSPSSDDWTKKTQSAIRLINYGLRRPLQTCGPTFNFPHSIGLVCLVCLLTVFFSKLHPDNLDDNSAITAADC